MKSNSIRKLISLLILCFCIISIGLIILNGQFPLGRTPDDFIAYWSSGRLLLLGQDPYSPLDTMELTEEIGFGDSGLYLSYFYPPWTLPFFLPLSALAYPISRSIWFVISIVVFISCTLWIWNIYAGPIKKSWIVILCIFLISPVIFALLEGQVTPFILLGIVGFMYFEERHKWFTAGALLALTTFKINILYLFWITLIIWVIYNKRWQVIAGLVVTLAFFTLIILIIHPNSFTEFLRNSSENLPTYCTNPSLSSILCKLYDQRETWHILLGPILGVTWLIVYWQRLKDGWDWLNTTPMLIFISLITVPYTWMHDGLLYTIAVLQIIILFLNQGISRSVYILILLFIMANVMVFILANNFRDNQIIFVWLPIVYLLLYLISKKLYSLKSFFIKGTIKL